MSSLTNEAQATVNLEQEEFVTDEIGCGPKLLHVIIYKSTIQKCGTVMDLHTQIMQLLTHILNVCYDIKVFNEHAKTLWASIGQYQENVNESLLTSIFVAYYVPDQEFQ